MKTIKRSQLSTMIHKTNGRLFSAEFIKVNGDTRKITARLGVHKNLRGGVSNVADKPNYVLVYDIHANGYRTINIDTTTKIKTGGTVYEVI